MSNGKIALRMVNTSINNHSSSAKLHYPKGHARQSLHPPYINRVRPADSRSREKEFETALHFNYQNEIVKSVAQYRTEPTIPIITHTGAIGFMIIIRNKNCTKARITPSMSTIAKDMYQGAAVPLPWPPLPPPPPLCLDLSFCFRR